MTTNARAERRRDDRPSGGITPEQRFSPRRPCPVCGGHQGGKSGIHCSGYSSPDGAMAFCSKTTLAGALRPIVTAADTVYAHRLSGACKCGHQHGGPVAPSPASYHAHAAPAPDLPPLSPEKLDAVFRRYLALLPRRPEHDDYYAGRGDWDLLAAEGFHYGSLPMGRDEGRRVVDALLLEFGPECLERVPGFWRGSGGRIATHTASPGEDAAVIPCYGLGGRIVSMVRQRVTGSGPKYKNFQGSRDLCTINNAETEPSGDVWLVEGAHKAHVASIASGLLVIGLTGAHLNDGAMALLAEFKPAQVVTALDMDRLTNPAVAAQQEAMVKRLTEAGYTVLVATWDGDQAKGLDDLLKAGGLPGFEAAAPDAFAEWAAQMDAEGDAAPPTATGRALASARIAELYEQRGHRLGEELVTLQPRVTNSRTLNVIRVGDGLTKAERVELLALTLEGRPSMERMTERAEECGWATDYICRTDGPRFSGHASCKLGCCTACLSQSARRLALSHLPDLEGEAGYRSIWWQYEIPLNTDRAQEQLTAAYDWWEDRVRGLTKHDWKGRILSRGIAPRFDPGVLLMQCRLLVREETQGEADALLAELQAETDGWAAGDKRTQSGETAIEQAMEDSSSTLLGMSAPNKRLFEAWYWASQGRRLFQTFGPLFKAERAREEEEPVVCDVCGDKVSCRVRRPEVDTEGLNAFGPRPKATPHRYSRRRTSG